jgi:hypothetical protein
MKINLLIIIAFVSLFHGVYSEGIFYHKHSEFTVHNDQVSYKIHSNVQSHLICLSYCNRESNCQTANFNEQTKACSLYDIKINTNNLVSQSSSAVFIVKGNKDIVNSIVRSSFNSYNLNLILFLSYYLFSKLQIIRNRTINNNKFN